MKKILMVLFALMLFVLPVMAQEIDNPEIVDWEGEMENSFIEKGYAGQFYIFEDYGLQFLVPAGLEPVELSEEDQENGVIGLFATEDFSVQIIASFLNYGVETLEEVAAMEKDARGDNMKFLGYYVINGLNGILFADTANDTFVCNISTSVPENFIKIVLTPISNEDLNALSGYIMASIMPYSEQQ